MARIVLSIIQGLSVLGVSAVVRYWCGVPVRRWLVPAVIAAVSVSAMSYFLAAN